MQSIEYFSLPQTRATDPFQMNKENGLLRSHVGTVLDAGQMGFHSSARRTLIFSISPLKTADSEFAFQLEAMALFLGTDPVSILEIENVFCLKETKAELEKLPDQG